MIVRIPGEGQFRINDDSGVSELDFLDGQLEAALQADDESAFHAALEAMHTHIHAISSPLSPDAQEPSDLILPPADTTMGEIKRVLYDSGLVPDGVPAAQEVSGADAGDVPAAQEVSGVRTDAGDVPEAEEYAEEDRKRREEAEVLNQADTLVYSTDTDAIKSDTGNAGRVSQKMGTIIYQQDRQSGGVDQGVRPSAGDEVVEHEILDEAAEVASQAAQTASATASDRNRRKDAASDVPVLTAFVSYSHKDERYRQALDISLAQLKRNGLISVWYDKKILPGEQWDKEIDRNIETADIILVLVSPDLLASDYAYTREMQRAIKRHRTGLTTVIPVILRPSDWQNSPLSDLQALPSNGRPISIWSKRDQAWLDVVHGLRKLVSSRG